MIRERWSEADITAYLDGQLEPGRLTVFENALAQNSVLRQRVDALRKTLAVLRETPLREAPRNYLLSPSMVANPKPARQSRPWSIGFMRLATSLTAAAFVLTMGLNVLNRGLAPSAFMEQRESLQLMENGAVMKEDTGDTIVREAEEPVLMIAADTPTSEAETIEEKAFAVEEPAELDSETPVSEEVMEAAPVAEVEAEDTVGMGGGGEQSEVPQVEGEMKVAPESAVEVGDTTGGEGEGEEPAVLEVAESPEIPEEESVLGAVEEDEPERTLVDEDAVEELDYASEEGDGGQPVDDSNGDAELVAAPAEVRTEVAPETGQDVRTPPNLFWRLVQVTPPQWVPISLGILTFVLFGVTVLISSRRR